MIEQENGTYRWTGTVDEVFDKKAYTIVFGVMGGMCVFFLVMALVVNPEMLLITLSSVKRRRAKAVRREYYVRLLHA